MNTPARETGRSAAMTLLDKLQDAGYDPQDNGPANVTGDWYDLVVNGAGTLRLVINPDDDHSAEVHAFDEFMCNRWSARFTPGTPSAVIIACLDAGEWELAALRGGPVTPAQAASIR